jgi:hypothetical protein
MLAVVAAGWFSELVYDQQDFFQIERAAGDRQKRADQESSYGALLGIPRRNCPFEDTLPREDNGKSRDSDGR